MAGVHEPQEQDGSLEHCGGVQRGGEVEQEPGWCLRGCSLLGLRLWCQSCLLKSFAARLLIQKTPSLIFPFHGRAHLF